MLEVYFRIPRRVRVFVPWPLTRRDEIHFTAKPSQITRHVRASGSSEGREARGGRAMTRARARTNPRILGNRHLDYGNTCESISLKDIISINHCGLLVTQIISLCDRAKRAHMRSMDVMDPIGPITPALYTSISPTATESTFNGSPIKQEDALGLGFEHSRKKQKRNKPTLSCEECVERKTKVS